MMIESEQDSEAGKMPSDEMISAMANITRADESGRAR